MCVRRTTCRLLFSTTISLLALCASVFRSHKHFPLNALPPTSRLRAPRSLHDRDTTLSTMCHDPYLDARVSLTVHERLDKYSKIKDAPATKESSKNLHDSPLEILVLVSSFLFDRNDLANLCRVSTRLFAAARPVWSSRT